jgi:hypothetical protein
MRHNKIMFTNSIAVYQTLALIKSTYQQIVLILLFIKCYIKLIYAYEGGKSEYLFEYCLMIGYF